MATILVPRARQPCACAILRLSRHNFLASVRRPTRRKYLSYSKLDVETILLSGLCLFFYGILFVFILDKSHSIRSLWMFLTRSYSASLCNVSNSQKLNAVVALKQAACQGVAATGKTEVLFWGNA